MRSTKVILMLGLLAVGAPAAAHPLTNPKTVALGDSYCVRVNPSVFDDETTGDGTSGARTNSYERDCDTRKVKAATSIAHKMWIYHSPTADGTGAVCLKPQNWYYNTKRTAGIYSEHPYGAKPPCGKGFYWTVVLGKVYAEGAWHGGVVKSPRHYVNP